MILEFIKSERFFPSVIIALQACAAARWAAAGSAWNSLYWGLAVGLNAVVTFGKIGS
jgi:hypothetical protein